MILLKKTPKTKKNKTQKTTKPPKKPKNTSQNCRLREHSKVSLQSLQKSEKAHRGLSKITALQNCLNNLNITESLNCEITAMEHAQEQPSSFHLRNDKRHPKEHTYNKNIEHQKYVLVRPKIFKKLGLFIKKEKVQPLTEVRYFYKRVRLRKTNSLKNTETTERRFASGLCGSYTYIQE